jgi:hypothetical protein
VYDYPAAKSDWMAAGLPTEGEASGRPTAGTVARRDVPTCHLEESLRMFGSEPERRGGTPASWSTRRGSSWGSSAPSSSAGKEDLTAESAMRPGPSTFRPHVPIAEMAEVMAQHDLPNAPVTTSTGKLIGLLVREDVERAAHERHA